MLENSLQRPPTLQDVYAARRALLPHLAPTPLREHPGLSQLAGCTLLVKHENHQPTGSFKVRGGINLVSRLSAEERKRGLVAASTGNHGQSIAYAGRLFDVPVTIGVPEGANPSKVASMRALGAEVVFRGRDFDEARESIERLATERRCRYAHSANEPDLIAGVATYALEVVEDRQDVDVVLVPVGGGSGAAGCALVFKALSPRTRVIAVGAEAAPAACLSWRERQHVEASMQTFAEGVATRVPFELTQAMLRESLDDFVLVSEDEIMAAIRLYLERACTMLEGAGAITLAAALRLGEELRGQRVVLVASGGNLSIERLRLVLEE